MWPFNLTNISNKTLTISIKPFHDSGLYHIETSPLICWANQWTGFYLITASVMKGLKYVYWLDALCFCKCFLLSTFLGNIFMTVTRDSNVRNSLGNFRSSHQTWSAKNSVLRNFESRSATLLKRDSNTGILLWNLRNS